MFSGMSNHSVDTKGRIVLPAKFREALGESFYVARGFGNACIQAMSAEQFRGTISLGPYAFVTPIAMIDVTRNTTTSLREIFMLAKKSAITVASLRIVG